jgi:hypothetical protein
MTNCNKSVTEGRKEGRKEGKKERRKEGQTGSYMLPENFPGE